MAGIPITVRCECGQVHEAILGETVRCSCGRRHDTQAPEEVRQRIFRARRGLEVAKRSGLILIPAAGLLGMALTQRIVGVLAGPVVAVPWFALVLPFFRRRYAQAMGQIRWTSE